MSSYSRMQADQPDSTDAERAAKPSFPITGLSRGQAGLRRKIRDKRRPERWPGRPAGARPPGKARIIRQRTRSIIACTRQAHARYRLVFSHLRTEYPGGRYVTIISIIFCSSDPRSQRQRALCVVTRIDNSPVDSTRFRGTASLPTGPVVIAPHRSNGSLRWTVCRQSHRVPVEVACAGRQAQTTIETAIHR